MNDASGFAPDPSWPSIIELATKLWGDPTDTHKADDIRFGSRQSKSVNPAKNTWRDYEAGEHGGYADIHLKAIGPLPNGEDKTGPEPWFNVASAYDYRDANGVLIAQNCRMKPDYRQRFMQRRPKGFDDKGRQLWRWSTKGLAIPLYRMPEMAAADPDAVRWLTEGEKDADRLAAAGLVATTNIAGAASWKRAHNGIFAGRHVVILEDNDEAGRKRSARIAPGLIGIAASAKVLALPGLPEKGDVSDWLDAGGTIEDLQRLAAEAPEYVPPAKPDALEKPFPRTDAEAAPAELDQGEWEKNPDATRARPGESPQLQVIVCKAGELDRMYREAEAALLNSNLPIYQRTVLMKPATVEYDAANNRKTHSAVLVPIAAPALTKMLSRAAIFVKYNERKKTHVECDPPPRLVDIILASRGDWLFPVVRGVLTTPTLRYDGSVLKDKGYDPKSRYYIAFPSNLKLPDIPEAPTIEAAVDALDRLDRLLDGYDFVDDGGISRSVALAILMTQVLRCAMTVSPLLAVSATAPGTGKSHLVDLASIIATGRWCPIINAGKDDKETEKGINTKLISGVAGFSIDNVYKRLNLEVLNTATERPLLSPRQFGTLTDIEVENSVVIYMTGNNLDVIDEQVRRTLLCRMDAGQEQPEQREFKNDPIQTVLAERGQYIADVLTIARAYLVHGSKRNDMKPFGSYPEWSRFVREPLIWLGQPDPVASQQFLRANDPVAGGRRTIIDAWFAAFGMEAHTLSEAVSFATKPPLWEDDPEETYAQTEVRLDAHKTRLEHHQQLFAALREEFPAGRDGIDAHHFGNWMRRATGRLTSGLKFVKAEGIGHGGGARWRLSR